MKVRLATISAATLASCWLAACGGSSHDVVVARVAGVDHGAITQTQFEHWARVTLKATQAQVANAPDPPRYERCVAESRKQFQSLRPPPGLKMKLPKPTTAQLAQGCKKDYERIRQQALTFLVEGVWIRQEAAAHGIELNAGDVAAQTRKEEAQLGITNAAALRRYLDFTGMTKEDFNAQMRVHALAAKLGAQQTAKLAAPTAAEISAYYARHSGELVQPERRDLLVLVTAGRPQALEAVRRLRAGASFAAVARTFSIDGPTTSAGGRRNGYTAGQMGDPPVDKAIAGARVGIPTGPVHGQRGNFWVFEVTHVTLARPLPIEQARSRIRDQLIAERTKKVLTPFMTGLQAKWKLRTSCLKELVIPDCRGAAETPSRTQVAPRRRSSTSEN